MNAVMNAVSSVGGKKLCKQFIMLSMINGGTIYLQLLIRVYFKRLSTLICYIVIAGTVLHSITHSANTHT